MLLNQRQGSIKQKILHDEITLGDHSRDRIGLARTMIVLFQTVFEFVQ